MNKEERNSFRKEMLGKLEEQWAKNNRPEDDLFYYHPSEDKIVLSHALFWVMTQNIKGKVGKEKYLLLLRQYQEDMLEAYLTESEDFKDLLHYCISFFPANIRVFFETTKFLGEFLLCALMSHRLHRLHRFLRPVRSGGLRARGFR